MRNAVLLDENLVITTDNSGGIGEKAQDIVAVSDETTAYYAARVALLEQWAAQANPAMILIHNFSGQESWDKYVSGVSRLLKESGVEELPISGSTETNMKLLQSAVAVTMIGKRKNHSVTLVGKWFVYGAPLVGEEVLHNAHEVASLQKLKEALDTGIVQRIWPAGSKGLLHEIRQVLKDEHAEVESALDLYKSAGPSTAVLVHVPVLQIEKAKTHFGETLREIKY